MAINEDIRTYTPGLAYDLLAAGFPCTDLSHAGGRAGIFGPSSGLVEHVFRIVHDTQPQWVLLENVPNLLDLHSGAGMDYVIGQIEDLGYKWAYRTVDARFTGVPQRRPRVIILATREHDPAPVLLDEDAGASEEPKGTASGFYWTEGRTGLGLVAGAIPTLKGGSTLGLPSAPAVWFRDRERGQRLVLPGIEDGEAFQGFPRGWTEAAVVPGEPDLRWKLIGNAVPVGIGRWLGDRLSGMPTSSSDAGETIAATREILRGKRWPKAGWGESGHGHAADVTEWPRREAMTSLADIVQTPAPLSHRATKGFLSRVEEAGRAIPEQFRRDIEEHMRQVRPVPSRPSWAANPDSRRRMQIQRQKNTKPELAIRSLLHKRGRRFRLQVRPSPKMRQRIDIGFPSEKVAVDVRGCFWHRCPDHGTAPTANAQRWADKLARNVARDLETEQTLTALGWLVIVIWEHEDPETAAARIDAAVLARRYLAEHQTTTQLKRAVG